MTKNHPIFSVLAFILVFAILLATPILSLADDGLPPEEAPAMTATPEPADPIPPTEETAPTGAPSPADVLPPTEVPLPEEVPPPTEAPVPDEELPTFDPSVPPVDTPSAVEEPSLPDVIPADDPVVTATPDISEAEAAMELPTGEESLAAETETATIDPALAAEAAIDSSDPVWCPAGVTPGDPSCAAAGTVTDLLATLAAHPELYNGDGTIYFQTGTYTGPESVITIDSSVLPDLGALVLFGGWDIAGSNTETGSTTFLTPLEIIWEAAVSLINLIVTLPSGSTDAGITVDSGGAIVLDNVHVTGGSSGAELVNYRGSGGVSVTDSEFDHNTNTGLLIISAGDVTLLRVLADGNNNGIVIDNTRGAGYVSLTDLLLDGNAWTGLSVTSAGTITLTDVEADNSLVGAYLDATAGAGNIFVYDSVFTGNDQIGLKAITNTGNITIDGVTTDGLGDTDTIGAWLKSYGGGTIHVIDSGFNNGGTGLFAVGTNDVVLTNVTASGNAGDGVVVESGWVFGCFGPDGIDVTVNGGTFTNNGGVGLAVYPGPNGTSTLLGTITYLNNLGGDYSLDLARTCVPAPEEEKEPGKPYQEVIWDGEGDLPTPMDCETYAGIVVTLPDGSTIKINCPVEGDAIIDVPTEDELPGPLPGGVDFAGGVEVGLTDGTGEVLVLPDGASMLLSFTIPAGMEDREFAVMFWDPAANGGAGAWIELPLAQFGGQIFPLHSDTPEDGMMILGGVSRCGNTVTVKVTFTGTFVLVAR